jgi:hypothetical protein
MLQFEEILSSLLSVPVRCIENDHKLESFFFGERILITQVQPYNCETQSLREFPSLI